MNNKMIPQNSMILALSPVCVRQFYTAHRTTIRRLDPYQIEKDDCSYCGIRTGWDYIIAPRAENNLRWFRNNTCRLEGKTIGSK